MGSCMHSENVILCARQQDNRHMADQISPSQRQWALSHCPGCGSSAWHAQVIADQEPKHGRLHQSTDIFQRAHHSACVELRMSRVPWPKLQGSHAAGVRNAGPEVHALLPGPAKLALQAQAFFCPPALSVCTPRRLLLVAVTRGVGVTLQRARASGVAIPLQKGNRVRLPSCPSKPT